MNLVNRENLPFRRNCEGYFICDNNEIVARDTGKGFIEFPGGGINIDETPQEAILRESFEEAGVIIEGKLKKLEILNFIWGENWAKTEKQKRRYNEFKGEEMHFFIRKVMELVKPKGDPENNFEKWSGNVKMPVKKIIDFIENSKPFNEDIKDYREIQLKILRNIYERN